MLQWEVETKYFQIFSLVEGFIHQHDQYGNLVPGLYEFDVEVIENGTNLIIPVTDIQFRQVGLGIQLFSFTLTEPGDFKLMIYHKEQNNSISTMPFHFTVYIGTLATMFAATYISWFLSFYAYYASHINKLL